jgi:hypothetical protein
MQAALYLTATRGLGSPEARICYERAEPLCHSLNRPVLLYDTAEGIPWIEHGIRDFRAAGSVLGLPGYLALKAEALHLADRTSEALEAINDAEALAERFEQRGFIARILLLRGVFLTAVGADEAQIEASFCEAIRIAREPHFRQNPEAKELLWAGVRR